MSFRAAVLLQHAQMGIDRFVVTPKTREQFYNNAIAFSRESPLYFTFLALQFSLAAVPLLLFTAFASSTVLFSISAAILFAFFWIAVALCMLIPALLVTTSIATIAFLWLAGTYLAAKWSYSFVPVNAKTAVGVRTNEGGKKLMIEKKSEDFQDLEIKTMSVPGNHDYSNGDSRFD